MAVAAGMTSQKGAVHATDPHCDETKPSHRSEDYGGDCPTKTVKPTVTVTKTVTATPSVTATVPATATVTATATACGTGVDSSKPNGNEQFLAALRNGVPFAGRRITNTDPDNPNIVSGPANDPGWTDLSTIAGFPTNSSVCGVSVDAQGSDAFYKIITQGGTVYTLHCAATNALVCPAPAQGQQPASQWVAVAPQP
ncbi:hypothetical protein [Streptomyces olivochromogenes]|uniref:hypothetical protein n=1 Tax=Streptomyces olivochromogenes TaxID=1963 RepID=UPI001F429239|nr:hypothetical protein [Streptomyces olivochromogenes]MCF3130822.1 hypothetical protein [Streptomyces olivochromogenes]